MVSSSLNHIALAVLLTMRKVTQMRWPLDPEPYTYKKNSPQLGTTLLLISIILILAILMQPSAGQVTVFSNQYTEYIVEPGDTLWSIARDHRKPRQDIRDLVWELQEVNEITPVIHPGQVLWVPEVRK